MQNGNNARIMYYCNGFLKIRVFAHSLDMLHKSGR